MDEYKTERKEVKTINEDKETKKKEKAMTAEENARNRQEAEERAKVDHDAKALKEKRAADMERARKIEEYFNARAKFTKEPDATGASKEDSVEEMRLLETNVENELRETIERKMEVESEIEETVREAFDIVAATDRELPYSNIKSATIDTEALAISSDVVDVDAVDIKTAKSGESLEGLNSDMKENLNSASASTYV